MKITKLFVLTAFILALFCAPSFAAWTIIAGSETDCTTCGVLQKSPNVFIMRVKIVSDGTTATAAENYLIPNKGYIGRYLWDVTVVNPAADNPTGAWNLELQDSASGKVVVEEDAVDNTASANVPIAGDAKTGKPEKIVGSLRLVVDDTDMGDTEYVYLLITWLQ